MAEPIPGWTFDTAGASFPGSALAVVCGGVGIINEFDFAQVTTPPSGNPQYLEENWKDLTAGINNWQNFSLAFSGSNIVSAPAAVRRLDDSSRCFVFAIGQLGWGPHSPNVPLSLIFWNWTAGKLTGAVDGWVAGVSLPGSVGTVANVTPAAVAWAAGRLDVFAISTTNTLLHWWLIEADGPGFSGPETLESLGIAGPPAAVSWAPGRIDVFASNTGGSLLHWWVDQFNGVPFGAPETLGRATSPCAVSYAPTRLDVFATSPQNTLVHWWFDGTVQPIQTFQNPILPVTLGGSNGCGPAAAVSWGPSRFDVFAASQGGLLHWYNGVKGLEQPDNSLKNLQPNGNMVLPTEPPACATGGVGKEVASFV